MARSFRIEDIQYQNEIAEAKEKALAYLRSNKGKEFSEIQVLEALYPLNRTREGIAESFVRGAATYRALEILAEEGMIQRKFKTRAWFCTVQ